MNDLIIYQNDINLIKNAILTSQHKVVKSANAEMLSLYYGIGRYVSIKTRKDAWGTNAIETISNQLQKELPGLHGFSTTNMKYMRGFYESWCDIINRQPSADDLNNSESKDLISTDLLSKTLSIIVNRWFRYGLTYSTTMGQLIL